MSALPTPVILDDYQQYAMPLIDVIGLGSAGRRALQALEDAYVSEFYSTPDQPASRVVRLCQEADVQQPSSDTQTRIILLGDDPSSWQWAEARVADIRQAGPDLGVLMAVAVSDMAAFLAVQRSVCQRLARQDVNVLLIPPHAARSPVDLLVQVVVMVANPWVSGGYLCIDAADFRTFLHQGGMGVLGFGCASRETEPKAPEVAATAAVRHLTSGFSALEGATGLKTWALLQTGSKLGYEMSEYDEVGTILMGQPVEEGHCCLMCALRAGVGSGAGSDGVVDLMDTGYSARLEQWVEVTVAGFLVFA